MVIFQPAMLVFRGVFDKKSGLNHPFQKKAPFPGKTAWQAAKDS